MLKKIIPLLLTGFCRIRIGIPENFYNICENRFLGILRNTLEILNSAPWIARDISLLIFALPKKVKHQT
jgi:hypothetical protein